MDERTEFLRKEKYTILLADDDPDDRDLFGEAASYLSPATSIVPFKDGVELMRYLKQGPAPFDMIFLDLNMPKKNGNECLHEISHGTNFGSVPIIIYTTSLNPIDIDGAFSGGAFRFFKKPNSFDELKEILSLAIHVAIDKSIPPTKENFVLVSRSGSVE